MARRPAALLKVTPRTVQSWIRTGRLLARCYGRFDRLRVVDLAQFGHDVPQET